MLRSEQTRYVPPFFIFNKLLLVSGIDLYLHSNTESQMRKYLRCIRNFIFIALSWIFTIYWARPFSLSFQRQLSLWASLSQISMNIHIIWHLREVRQFIADLSASLSDKKRSLLMYICLLWVMIGYTVFIAFLWSLLGENLKQPQFAIPMLYGLTISFQLSSIPLQFFTLILVYFQQKEDVKILYSAAREARADILFDVSQRMISMRSHFDKLFSMHPLIWLVYQFILQTFFLTKLSERPSNSLILHLAYQQLILFVAFFLMIWVSERISRHQGHLVFIFAMSSDTGHREMCPSISRSLDEALACRFTVWGLFPVNRELFFSLISTVLTFAVLAIQINNGSFKSQDKVEPNNQILCTPMPPPAT